jgi:hypothetical protein
MVGTYNQAKKHQIPLSDLGRSVAERLVCMSVIAEDHH